VSELAGFAGEIRGWDDARLIHTLNLSAPTGAEDGVQDGLAQQFEDSCVPSTAQVLRGELDPVYSLQVRRQNADVHAQPAAGTQDPNPAASAEQRQLLEQVGNGTAVPVGTRGGAGVEREKIDDILNAVSRQTGLQFHSVTLTPQQRGLEQKEQLLDGMADQLRKGIPTPFEVRTPDGRSGHYALALAVEGEGPKQRFLVHDPYSGNTGYVTREEFEWGPQGFPHWDVFRIAGFAQAGEPPPSPPRTDQAR
jgi:hypothetical protein